MHLIYEIGRQKVEIFNIHCISLIKFDPAFTFIDKYASILANIELFVK